MDWRRNEDTRVMRRRGPRKRQTREKKREPRMKQKMEVPDRAQPKALLMSRPEAPMPRKMVLPGELHRVSRCIARRLGGGLKMGGVELYRFAWIQRSRRLLE